MGKCKFNPVWVTKQDYSKWLRPVKSDAEKALCCMCNRVFDIGAMGESALRSHAKGNKHMAAAGLYTKNNTIMSFMKAKTGCKQPVSDFRATTDSSIGASEEQQSPARVISAPTMAAHVAKSDGLQAEVLWTLRTVSCHQSYRSVDNSDKLFAKMFPDSGIAAKFTCAAKKASYMTVFGIAEYIKQELTKCVSTSGPFVLMFDKSLNKKSQKKQMDVHVRFWDASSVVQTRYLDSVFLGKCLVNSQDAACQDWGGVGPMLLQHRANTGAETVHLVFYWLWPSSAMNADDIILILVTFNVNDIVTCVMKWWVVKFIYMANLFSDGKMHVKIFVSCSVYTVHTIITMIIIIWFAITTCCLIDTQLVIFFIFLFQVMRLHLTWCQHLSRCWLRFMFPISSKWAWMDHTSIGNSSECWMSGLRQNTLCHYWTLDRVDFTLCTTVSRLEVLCLAGRWLDYSPLSTICSRTHLLGERTSLWRLRVSGCRSSSWTTGG